MKKFTILMGLFLSIILSGQVYAEPIKGTEKSTGLYINDVWIEGYTENPKNTNGMGTWEKRWLKVILENKSNKTIVGLFVNFECIDILGHSLAGGFGNDTIKDMQANLLPGQTKEYKVKYWEHAPNRPKTKEEFQKLYTCGSWNEEVMGSKILPITVVYK
jgi:hypothetical protein